MNYQKFKTAFRISLPFLAGIFLLYLSFQSVFDLKHINNELAKINFPDIARLILLILIPGMGLTLGMSLISTRTWQSEIPILSFIYSILILILNLYLTLTEGFTHCGCTSVQESLLDVKDWSGALISLLAFFLCFIFFLKKIPSDNQNPDSMSSVNIH